MCTIAHSFVVTGSFPPAPPPAAFEKAAVFARELAKLSATGRPLNRPSWWDFPGDAAVWEIDDEFAVGDDWLAAPVLIAGAVARDVYLPALPGGGMWTHVFTNETFAGGATHVVAAPVGTLPLFQKGLASLTGSWVDH